jgi:hypothetical protein
MVLASGAGAKPFFPTTLLKGVNKISRHLFDPQPMGFHVLTPELARVLAWEDSWATTIDVPPPTAGGAVREAVQCTTCPSCSIVIVIHRSPLVVAAFVPDPMYYIP